MLKIDPAYNQPTDVASAGITTPAAKVTGDIKNDALGNPGRYARNQTTVATEQPNSELIELRECQLGSNGYQSAGYSAKPNNSPAPVRGFGNTEADKGGYQGK
jgi:hypothetical protein